MRLSYHDHDSDGVYEGFDRFGRVVDHRWYDDGSASDVDHFQHGYDRAGNRLWREHVSAAVPQDELYSYDDLHRLVDTQRGTLNAGRTALTAGSLALRQAWGLDAVGNWSSFDEDDDGDGVWDLDQTRSHNLVNEITDITETAGPAWVTPQHDAAGNMTQMPRPAPGSATATWLGSDPLIQTE